MTPEQTFTLALQHHQAGRLAEAETLYREVLTQRREHAEAWHLLGVIAHQVGRYANAVQLIEHSISLAPRNPPAHSNLGEAQRLLGHGDAALACYRQAITINPQYGVAHFNLANLLRTRGEIDEAIAEYHHALALKPDYIQALNNLSLALIAKKQFTEAIATCQRALELNPGFVEARVHLANALKESNRLEEAVAEYRTALQQNPDFAEAHNNLGNALRDQGHTAEAVDAYRTALRLRPDYAEAQGNLGMALAGQGEFSEAEAAFREALVRRPDLPDVHLNLGLLLLLHGRYEEGWREYQWRWQSSHHAIRRREFAEPAWDGAPIPGRTLLVHVEQGLGDTLHFARYLPLIVERANARLVILECDPALVPFLAQLETDRLSIVARGASSSGLPPFDFQFPLPDSPLALGCFEPLPPAPSFLQADAKLRTQWRKRLGRKATFRVGVAWSGNPQNENDRRRSIAPELLAPLLRLPGISVISLQIDPDGPLPAALTEHEVFDAKPHISSFADSAALIAELDLVISVDTAVAHLAGALNVPVWTLLPFVPDWRWGLKSKQTPWYPTMRLFRQARPGDWKEVIKRVARELEGTASGTAPKAAPKVTPKAAPKPAQKTAPKAAPKTARKAPQKTVRPPTKKKPRSE